MLYKKGQRHAVSFTLNGKPVSGEAEPRMLLVDFLRHELGVTGTHVGCEHGVCGACTVQIDGEPARACLTYALRLEGRDVRTVEALAGEDDALSPLQQAFKRNHALQCGFCTPGILMTLDAWLKTHPSPNEQEIREALSGNICRCTGYAAIVRAVLDYVAKGRHA